MNRQRGRRAYQCAAGVVVVIGLAAAAVAQEQRVMLNGVLQEPAAGARIIAQAERVAGGAAGGAPIPVGTGLIMGQVVEAGSARPVANTFVTLQTGGNAPLRALADGQGRFVFRDLPPGSYSIDASRGGYIDGAAGRLRPRGQARPIVLEEGARVTDAKITLWKFGAIAGTVLDEAGEPMIGATVRVLQRTSTGGMTRLTLGASDRTDDRGAFRISSLEPGDYIVCVPMSSQGALVAALESVGRTGNGGLDVIMSAMPAGGSMSYANVNGAVSISLDSEGSISAGRTADGAALSYPTWYYPAALSASRATFVTIGTGEERSDVDFQIRPLPTSRVSGVVASPNGSAADLTVTLLPMQAGDLIAPIETATARTNAAGAFTFDGVPQGEYVLRVVSDARMNVGGPGMTFTASMGNGEMRVERMIIAGPDGAPPPPPPPPPPGQPASATLWGSAIVAADRPEVTGISVVLRSGFTVSGQTEWAGAAQRPEPRAIANISVTLDPADARTAAIALPTGGRLQADGTFTTSGAVPGRYVLRVTGLPRGWQFRGATAGGHDVADLPFDLDNGDLAGVTLTLVERLSSIAGTVVASAGSVDELGVVVFPTEREAWTGYGSGARRVRYVRADAKGTYKIDGLPPGRYYVAAVHDATSADWQNPEFLATLSNNATTVELAAGQSATQSVRAR